MARLVAHGGIAVLLLVCMAATLVAAACDFTNVGTSCVAPSGVAGVCTVAGECMSRNIQCAALDESYSNCDEFGLCMLKCASSATDDDGSCRAFEVPLVDGVDCFYGKGVCFEGFCEVCGNGACQTHETCDGCPEDCGLEEHCTVDAVCGDDVCTLGAESCSNCADDCDACPGVCGNDVCDADEACDNCEPDCGVCPNACGNGVCEPGAGETCTSCKNDCRECTPVCGDNVCDTEELCVCATDCGNCASVCGDGVCSADETCGTCAADCAVCATAEVAITVAVNADGESVTSVFTPPAVSVRVGDIVQWNDAGDSYRHAVTQAGDGSNVQLNSGLMVDGASFSYRFEQPGMYAYADQVFGGDGGMVTVTFDGVSHTLDIGADGVASAAAVYIEQGESVVFTNVDPSGAAHTLTDSRGLFVTAPLAAGESFEFVYANGGAFPFFVDGDHMMYAHVHVEALPVATVHLLAAAGGDTEHNVAAEAGDMVRFVNNHASEAVMLVVNSLTVYNEYVVDAGARVDERFDMAGEYTFVAGFDDEDAVLDGGSYAAFVAGTVSVTVDPRETDADGDGFTALMDCDDANAAVSPIAAEVCDGVDNNCDGQADEGFADHDRDGKADCVDGDIDGDGTANKFDCDSYDAMVRPNAPEVCDGVDNNCDNQVDELFSDFDGDGVADCVDDDRDNDGSPANKDCDDFDAAVHPGATELCDHVDNNCDGQVDEGFAGTVCASDDLDGDGWTVGDGDCDDKAADVHPGAAEVCDDDVDNDCNGAVDDGCGGCRELKLLPDGDSMIHEGKPMRNRGDATQLYVSGNMWTTGPTRLVIKFGTSELREFVGDGTVASAELRMYVVDNKAWKTGKDAIDVFRFKTGGLAKFEADMSWNCAKMAAGYADVAVAAEGVSADVYCDKAWTMDYRAPEDSEPLPFHRHREVARVDMYNDELGWQHVDVTADVAEYLAQTAEGAKNAAKWGPKSLAYILKSTRESKTGKFKIVSREGADVTTRPSLVVTVCDS